MYCRIYVLIKKNNLQKALKKYREIYIKFQLLWENGKKGQLKYRIDCQLWKMEKYHNNWNNSKKYGLDFQCIMVILLWKCLKESKKYN